MAVTAEPARLSDLPNDLSESYLPFTPTLRQRQKAHAFSKGHYIQSVQLFNEKDGDSVHISARVFRSQRKSESPHHIDLSVNKQQQQVTVGHCSCKAGISGECSHVVAVLFTLRTWILEGLTDVPSEPSCTSLPQQWDKPRGVQIRAEPVSRMVISNPSNTNRKRKPVLAGFNDNRKINLEERDMDFLRSLSGTPISYLAQSMDKTVQTKSGPQLLGSALSYHIPLIDPPITAPAYTSNICGEVKFPQSTHVDKQVLDQLDPFKSNWCHLALTQEEAETLEVNTKTQTACDLWREKRRERITASNFGSFITRKAELNNAFLNNLYQKEFKASATSYGTANEPVAKRLYIQNNNNRHIHDIGLVVNPMLPYLGASPDGIVCEGGVSGILEIKCPFAARNLKLDEARNTSSVKNFFLKKEGDTLKLDDNHKHWYQVQGQLLVTGAPFCDFVCYTKHDYFQQRVYPHRDTMELIAVTLAKAYCSHVKDYLNSLNQ